MISHTTIAEARLLTVHDDTIDLSVGGRRLAARPHSRTFARELAPTLRTLKPLPVDPGFYATLADAARHDYLRAHTRAGQRYGRLLLHRDRNGALYLTAPTDEGYRVEPLEPVEENLR